MPGNFKIDITHVLFLVTALNLLLWYFYVFQARPRSFLRLLALPFSHYRDLLNLRENPALVPLLFFYPLVMSRIPGLIVPLTPICYLIYTAIIHTFELLLPTAYVLKLKTSRSLLACLGISMFIAGLFGFLTFHYKNYQILNNFDFAVCICIFILSSIVIINIIVKERFSQDLDAFFAFFGFIIFCFLNILATIMLALDFMENVDFAFHASLIAQIFWLVSVPWIRRLRAKLA